MNKDELNKILNNPYISAEQKQALLEALKTKGASNATIKSAYKEEKRNTNLGNTASFKPDNIVKFNRPSFDKEFVYKDIPCKFDLFRIYYLANANTILNKNSNLIGAFILKWINEGKVYYKFKKGSLFNKPCHIIELDRSLKFDDVYENEIYDFIKRAAKDSVLTDKEFKDFCEKKKMELLGLLEEICDYEEKELVDKKLISKNVKKDEMRVEDEKNPLNTEGITLTSTFVDITFSKEIAKDIKEITGFKNYIKSLHTNTTDVLPNDYYVVCELLGITNFISHKFNEVYPEFYFRHYQYLHKIRSDFPQPLTAKEKWKEIGKMQIK